MKAQTEANLKPNPTDSPNPYPELYEGIEEDEDDEEMEQEEDPEIVTPEAQMRKDRAIMDSLARRISSETVSLRVHDLIIKGNRKTKDSLIEAEVAELFSNASSLQQVLHAAAVANARLQALDIFVSVKITLDAGPLELSETTNVVIEVSEPNNPLAGNFGVYSKPEARSWTLEGFLKLKNLFGYGDIWDGSLAYGWGQASEVSTGVLVPRFKRIHTPLSGRISLLSQDWLKFSSYKEQTLGLSLDLLATGNHSLSYNLSWRTLTDPSQMSSHAVRRQLGHSLLSALKYTFKVDQRDSPVRPTKGHALVSSTQICGLFPDIRSLRFIRQEFDIRYAIPLRFYHAALNFGISGGIVFPWGNGFLSTPSSLPERFFMGGTSSPVCSLSGPTSILGFKTRGLGPAEPRRFVRDNSDNPGIDYIGGDLAFTAFADLSFDLPLKVLRDAGIHGHVFSCTGSLNRLSENTYREFSLRKFRDSFRSSSGVGIIIPTKLFRMEVNYCHILKQEGHDQGKSGVQFSFSSPH